MGIMIDNRDCTLCIYYRPFGAGCKLGMGNEPCYRYCKRIDRWIYAAEVFDEMVDRWQGWGDYDRDHHSELSQRKRGDF